MHPRVARRSGDGGGQRAIWPEAKVGNARSGRRWWYAARNPATGSDRECPGRPPNPLFADLCSSRAIANVRIRAA
uniref:Uncharacterized protein n=1 Tax=Setaria italica TaxID=4555 RepID=K3ZG07_SETIT